MNQLFFVAIDDVLNFFYQGVINPWNFYVVSLYVKIECKVRFHFHFFHEAVTVISNAFSYPLIAIWDKTRRAGNPVFYY